MSVALTPAVAPNLPLHEFAFAFWPGAGHEPQLFIPISYPQPSERTVRGLNDRCDHTGVAQRRQMFVMLRRLETGGWVQVSVGALAEYLNDPVAAAELTLWIARQQAFERVLVDAMPQDGRSHFTIEEVIEEAVASIREYGWVSRGQAHQTGEKATAEYVLDKLEYVSEEDSLTVDDRQQATLIVAWLRRLHADEVGDARTPLTDYMHNLAMVASREYVGTRSVGLLCSAPAAYESWLALEQAKAANGVPPKNPGKHVGTIGVRQEADVFVDSIENRGENEWGVSLLVAMHIVPTGERLKWFTGDGLKLDEGKQYHVRMTVKKHSEWDGENETLVSHVAEYVPPVKPEKKPRGSKKK